ncbi:hypothetical protein NFI96_030973 [Prochilodus magdalenae]|nr:hypothetical protein NFI96_030973 [Prochilodus magdalenae]
MAEFIIKLSEEKKRIVDEAKEATLQIVQDAIDKQCYGSPVSFYYSCSEPVDSHTFCCIPTKEFLQKILAKLNEVSFKEDTNPDNINTFAYTNCPGEDTVYMCELFWSAPKHLCKDSQPGILIHEISHRLGTIDVSYKYLTVELYEEHGTLLGKSQCVEDDNGKDTHREEVLQVNADSLEYEFETIINHKEEYSNGRYPCCGETKINSVCKHRSTGHYNLHERFGWQRAEMKRKVDEFWNAHAEGQKMKYVKKKNKACEVIPVSGL